MRRLLIACIAALLAPCLAHAQTGVPPTQGAGPPTAQAPAAQADLAEATQLSKSVVQLFKAQKYDEAIPLAERALALREKALGPADPQVAGTLANLAVLYLAKGKFDKSEPLYLRALSLYEQARGADNAHLAEVLSGLSMLNSRKGDFGKSAAYLERVLTLKEKMVGPEHVEVGRLLFTLATLYAAKGDYYKADATLGRACDRLRASLPPEDQQLQNYYDQATCLLASTGNRIDVTKVFKPPDKGPAGAAPANGGVLNGKVIAKPTPPYPLMARTRRISGTVVVKILVDETGRVIKAQAICGDPILAKASEEAARDARFTPTLQSGQPMRVSGYITYSFNLQ